MASKWLADKENNLYVAIDDVVASVQKAVELGITTKKLLEVLKTEAQLAKNSFKASQAK